MSEAEGARLPARPPRPWVVHYLVDSAVLFLVAVVPASFLGASLLAIVITALIGGVVAAPYTRRREIEALAERERPEPPL